MLDQFDTNIPVYSDKNPNAFITWYNKVTKKVHSDEEYEKFPLCFDNYVRINRKIVEIFYIKARASLHQLKSLITTTLEHLSFFLIGEETYTGTQFLSMTSLAHKLHTFYQGLGVQNEEEVGLEEGECFDWLFCQGENNNRRIEVESET